MEPEVTPSMFANLSPANILSQATTWAGTYDDVLLVVVGLGVAFASVRFVKGLFF